MEEDASQGPTVAEKDVLVSGKGKGGESGGKCCMQNISLHNTYHRILAELSFGT